MDEQKKIKELKGTLTILDDDYNLRVKLQYQEAKINELIRAYNLLIKERKT